jgi:hypothetical protein
MKRLVTTQEAHTLARLRQQRQARAVTFHAQERLRIANERWGTGVSEVDILHFANRGTIIEFNDESQFSTPRIVSEYIQQGLRWKVTMDLSSRFVITCWANEMSDLHQSLDISRYTRNPVNFNTVLRAIGCSPALLAS